MKCKRIILIGPGGSGKDFLRKRLQGKGFIYGITYTTRPKREEEIDGDDYVFVTEEKFRRLIQEDFFIEFDNYRGWYYGTPVQEWEHSNIFTMTPNGVRQVKLNKGLDDTFVIYLNPNEEIRKKRLIERNDADNPDRRIKTDTEDFKDFIFYDIEVKNHDF